MRVALFSDVHGNAVGFDAFLADLDEQRVDLVVCLGDHAQGGPQPAECLERLRDLECPAVMGNSDDFLLTLDPGDEPVTEAQLETARWSQAQLSEEQLDFHRSFQPTVELDLGGGSSLLAFHGTPRSRDEVVGPGWKRRPSASRSRASRRRCSPVATRTSSGHAASVTATT